MKKSIFGSGLSIIALLLFMTSLMLCLGDVKAEVQQRVLRPRPPVVQKPTVTSVSPSKAVLIQGGEAVVIEVRGTQLPMIGPAQVTRSGVPAQGIEASLDKSQVQTVLKVALKAGSAAQVATDYLLTFYDANNGKLFDVPNTVLSIEVVASKTGPLGTPAQHRMKKQTAGQKIGGQTESNAIDVQDLQRKGINWKTLPDSRLIRFGDTIKSVEEIRRESEAARAKYAHAAQEISRQVQSELASRRAEQRKFYYAQTAQNKSLLDRKISGLKRSLPNITMAGAYQPGQYIDPPGPPVLDSIDMAGGRPGDLFAIQGKNFGLLKAISIIEAKYVCPTVIIIGPASFSVKAPVQVWTDSQIIAAVPEITGHSAFDGYVYVEMENGGKSEAKRFRVEPRMGDEVALPCRWQIRYPGKSAEIENLAYNMTPCNSTDGGYSPCVAGLDVELQHLEVTHWALFTTGCNGVDEFWQGMELKNGWTVASIVLYKLTESNDVSVSLANAPVGTNNPLVRVRWTMNGPNANIYCVYYLCVFIKGPEGTSWTDLPLTPYPR